MPSFDIPLSGLNADSTALNTIANNLSNMNTTGFKAQTTSFSDLLYQQVGASGSGDPIQVGSGVQVASNNTDFTTGNISSGVYTDAAINGTGFFVLDNGGGGQLLTRDGSFIVGSDGMLQSVNGQPVMGYMATNGVINPSGTLSDITVPVGQVMSPSATTSFSVTQNLDSTTAVGGASPQSTLQIYDSLGNSYQATVTYTKTGTNAWNYSISLPSAVSANSSVPGTISYTMGAPGVSIDSASNLTITGLAAGGGTATTGLPKFSGSPETITQYATDLTNALTAAGITTGAGGVTVTAAGSVLTISGATATSGNVIQDAIATNSASGSLTFDSSGNLVSPAADVSGITFSGLADGAAPINLTWNLYGTNGSSTLGQTASASSQSSQNQNGYAAGQYESFTIGSDGTITANYSNGQNQALAQIGIATVNNQQGLLDVGSTQYLTTRASGNASVGVAGTGGRGVIEGGELEASNVNISQEFSNLIIAQRAFEANSKAVTTFDTVTQETINMIH
jgi:flagellar hook protein FlgE